MERPNWKVSLKHIRKLGFTIETLNCIIVLVENKPYEACILQAAGNLQEMGCEAK
jgi:hypothetical protein